MRNEGVDVSLVVCEKHKALKVAGVGSGVVMQALDGEIHALGREQRKRTRLSGGRAKRPVGDRILDCCEFGHREHALERPYVFGLQIGGRLLHDKRKRDWPVRDADFKRDTVVIG